MKTESCQRRKQQYDFAVYSTAPYLKEQISTLQIMKLRILILIVITMAFVYNLSSCKKDCNCEPNTEVGSKDLTLNGNPMAFRSGLNGIKFTTITEKSVNVNQSIVQILQKLGINNADYNAPICAAFYLKDTIPANTNLEEIKPDAILLYDKMEDRIVTKFFKESNGTFINLPEFFAITSIYSETDVIDIMSLNFLDSKEIISFTDLSKINKSIYLSDLQLLLDKKLHNENYLALGGRPTSGCKEANPGCTIEKEGYCIPQERQNGPESYSCVPKEDKCTRTQTDTKSTFESAGESNSTLTNEKLYNVRDEILSNSFEGKKLIDDYYYSSMILKNNPISLEMALSAVEIFNTDFLKDLANLNNPDYRDKVIINSTSKSLLLDLCIKSKKISTDSRYLQIINSLEQQINLYENKSCDEIKSDFN